MSVRRCRWVRVQDYDIARCECCGRIVRNIKVWPIRSFCGCQGITASPLPDEHKPAVKRQKVSFWQMVTGFAKSMKDFVAEGMPWCVKEHYLERMKVCEACEHLVNNRCQLCGCKFNTKSKSPAWHCPDKPDRWAEVDAKYAHHYGKGSLESDPDQANLRAGTDRPDGPKQDVTDAQTPTTGHPLPNESGQPGP